MLRRVSVSERPAGSCADAVLEGIHAAASLERLVQGPAWIIASVRAPDGKVASGMAGIPRTARGTRCAALALALRSGRARQAAPSGGVALADVTCAGPTDAREWARLLLSSDPGETAIGLAVANAMLALAPAQAADIDGVDWLLQHARGRDVAVVGAFPFIDRELRPLARRVRVLEQRPAEGQMPESCAGDVLPQAEIVAITGGTLANHTLDALLHHTRPDAIRLLLGPSTPLTPALFRFGFHALAGVHVVDVDAARADVRAGRPFPRMRGLQRVTLLAPHPLRALDAPR